LPAHVEATGGLDHGIWTPLRSMFPQADLPVLPLAWPPMWQPVELFRPGEALAPLAAEGVLVVGSGAITHNLRLWAGGRDAIDTPEYPESAAFRGWVSERTSTGAGRLCSTIALRRHTPPTCIRPTSTGCRYVAAGAGGREAAGLRLHDSVTYGHLGMDTYAFGPQAGHLAKAVAAQQAT
jgi:4,5-DOPA dioxygenase extradiol